MNAVTLLALISMLVPPAAQKYNGETAPAAAARYRVIAQGIAIASAGDPWTARYLVAIARHESAFARSVHVGERRGDCNFNERGRILPNTCRSWGLFQENIGPDPGRRARLSHLQAKDLVGLDLWSTTRAATLAASRIRWARRQCGAKGPGCVFRRYGGVTSTEDPRITARVASWRKLGR